MEIKELSAIEAAYSYDLEHISQLRTKSFKQGFIGQPRAMKALSMGMAVNTKGYNIYISGEDGTGRHRAVKEIASSMEALIFYDIAYGCNFSKRQAPFLLLLKSPQGRALEKLCNTISALVEEEQYNKALDIAETIEKNIEGTQAYIRQVKTALLRKEKNGELFRINLVVDNSVSTKLPLVNEYHPTSQNLFGQRAGASSALHMNLSCGSLLEAIGGFFIVQIDKVLSQKGLWSSLKVFAESSSFILGQEDGEGKTIVRPVVPELPIKIILVGSDSLYDKLCEEDENFLRLFKVSAEFDFSMDATDENIQGTIAYIEDFIKENSLFNVETEAICQILTYSSWYAEMRGELTTKLSFLGDLLFEANYIAKKEGLFSINASHIKKAMEERDFVNGLTEERINRDTKSLFFIK